MHSKLGYPPAQALYHPDFEKDACGIGSIVSIQNYSSHQLIKDALLILKNLAHRGGAGAQEEDGDGAGILTQIPDAYFRSLELPFDLSKVEIYGVGMVFLPRHKEKRRKIQSLIESMIIEEGQKVLGWRYVPVNEAILSNSARNNRPHINQIFIESNTDKIAFERSLYVIRKRLEHITQAQHESDSDYFYFASLSSKTIVYKGMLTAKQVDDFYLDLQDERYASSLALVHSRFSTNTFPSWERAHPYRMTIHNGEINTLRANTNRMNARQHSLMTTVFGKDMHRLLPIVFENGSDSAIFDNTLEFFTQAGLSIAHSIMMMIPEPWQKKAMSRKLKDFYAFHQLHMEAWDGPAAMVFTDGDVLAATLDRNGLRPARFTLTKDDHLIIASEAGVLPLDDASIQAQGNLKPGQILYVDTLQKQWIDSDVLKENIASMHPYHEWLKNERHINDLEDHLVTDQHLNFEIFHKAFLLSTDLKNNVLLPMAKDGQEPIASMGHDGPLAILAKEDQKLSNYFHQVFAQVTNPPMDALREDMMISTQIDLGAIGNLLEPKAEDAYRLKLESPLLSQSQFKAILNHQSPGLKSKRIDATYPIDQTLNEALHTLNQTVLKAIQEGYSLLILSNRQFDEKSIPMESLLALSSVHQHLTKVGQRTLVSLLVESGDALSVHDCALLMGYGASAIYPYLALETLHQLIESKQLSLSYEEASKNYLKAATKGIVKIMSKMGISTLQSYQGSQIFEALGLSKSLIDEHFTNTISRIEGLSINDLDQRYQTRHHKAFDENEKILSGSMLRFKQNGEAHLFSPSTIKKLQTAVRENNYGLYHEVVNELTDENHSPLHLRSLLGFKDSQAIDIREVEPIESIVKRFKTGAMSYGSISPEAHESLAIAMNRLGAKSNTGEGGEDPLRYQTHGKDSKNSAIKQIASGRFGVTAEYLYQAKELQIKMAQGAKPGEGGQLPGKKVYPWIAKARRSTVGIGLISPPPHHDIYSIEDLAQLIHDLKNANEKASISVKLVSEHGVGTIAAGVAKGRADTILISGYDGGTGASPLSSIHHAGLPWELGLAETHQTLVLNELRSRVKLETDGKLMHGKDVVIATLLGAQEYGFATSALVALGCMMARVCHLDSCPVGIATQNPTLRQKFVGKPEDVVNFMRFIAQDTREWMAKLGFRSIDDMIGHSELLIQERSLNGINLSNLLGQSLPMTAFSHQNHLLSKSFDQKVLIPYFKHAIEKQEKRSAQFEIKNTYRVIGTQLGTEITRRYGSQGMEDHTISLQLKGTAGQSLGAFIPKGLSLHVEGSANDYCGKGLSGGIISIKTQKQLHPKAHDNTLIGNVAFFGASSGEAYINGCAGERFAVRNSGAKLIVEGIGNHGCEYMTSGEVIVLGNFGYNFAAGMSGGLAYVYDPTQKLLKDGNLEMVDLVKLRDDEINYVYSRLQKHIEYTDSYLAKDLLKDWEKLSRNFIKVYPKELRKYDEALKLKLDLGLSLEDAQYAVFKENN